MTGAENLTPLTLLLLEAAGAVECSDKCCGKDEHSDQPNLAERLRHAAATSSRATPDHYAEAERILALAQDSPLDDSRHLAGAVAALAHATLAIAQAIRDADAPKAAALALRVPPEQREDFLRLMREVRGGRAP